jgi:hypothetical protein
VRKVGVSASCAPREAGSGFGVRSVLRTGRIFDTPPLKGLTFASDRYRSLAH